MKYKIREYLSTIEQEKNIKILLACETGSRAWGFPSPDSDYDVRVIYVHKKDWYISLVEQKDSIDRMFEDNEIDVSGWDLRKSLRLLKKSNAALLERIQSPIIYQSEPDFLQEMKAVATTQYSRIATIHHYLSMAKKIMVELEEKKEYKLKKFFYALRSATACKWILEKDEIPPIEYQKMRDGLDIESSLSNRIDELISLKSTISEAYMHTGEEALISFIKSCIEAGNEGRHSLPPANGNSANLDSFFIKIVNQYDH